MKALLPIAAAAVALAAVPASADNGQILRDPGAQHRVDRPDLRQCFDGKLITGANRAGERTLYVQTSRGGIYELQMAGGCGALAGATTLSLRAHGLPAACVGERAQLVVGTPTGPKRCAVANVRSLAPDKLAALTAAPRRSRPKSGT